MSALAESFSLAVSVRHLTLQCGSKGHKNILLKFNNCMTVSQVQMRINMPRSSLDKLRHLSKLSPFQSKHFNPNSLHCY